MIRSLYSWTLRMAEHRHALWVLAFVAFIESSVFPIPPDILMIPMILAAPRRDLRLVRVQHQVDIGAVGDAVAVCVERE